MDREKFPEFEVNEARYVILTDSAGHMDSYEVWYDAKAEYLKKLLLFYPSVAVLDPVDELLSFAAENPSAYQHALEILLPIRPLIAKDVVRLIPDVTGRRTVLDQIELSPLLESTLCNDEILQAFYTYDPNNYKDIIDLNLELPGLMLSARELFSLRTLTRKNVPIGLLIWAVSVIKEMYTRSLMVDISGSNLAIIAEKDWRFYAGLMQVNPTALIRSNIIDGYIAPLILKFSLPNMHNIAWDDILAIRLNDEDFYLWREALGEVIKETYQWGYLSQEQFLKNAKEILFARSASLRESIKRKTSLKDKILDALIPAAIGFVGGMLSGDIQIAFAQSALTGLLSLLYSIFAKRPSKAEWALYRHFSVFLDKC